jgi:hypothetical protein
VSSARHQHTASCYSAPQLDCGTVAHQHNPACYARDGGREFLTCGQRVHSHVGSCYRKFLTCGK